jgi:hypothetical protein
MLDVAGTCRPICTAIFNELGKSYLQTRNSTEKWKEIAGLFLSSSHGNALL